MMRDTTNTDKQIKFDQTSFEMIKARVIPKFSEIVEQYSCFVFLVCMKYLKEEKKSKEASINIFKKLKTCLKPSNGQTIKEYIYKETKTYCLKKH